VTARQARAALNGLYKWAMGEGLLGPFPANPVVGTHKPADPQPRDRVLSDAELAAIWNACQDDEFGCIVRLLILLGNRRAEVGGMSWSELDFAAGTWLLPAARSKNKRSHRVVLPAAALAIIEAVPRRSDRDQLFGDRADTGFTDFSRGKQELDLRLGTTAKPWRLHDIRRTVANA